MRTIKFRGKRNHSGEWHYGHYTQGSFFHPASEEETVRHLIHADMLYDVDPETVGQFTGLYDKDGKEIYEGDIIKYTHEICIEDGPGTYVGAVSFYEGAFCLHEDSDCTVATAIYDSEEYGGICVIGNIHDNPELLTNE